jgi:23S rRNA (guanosine2251-2'-O)-methyltransferase
MNELDDILDRNKDTLPLFLVLDGIQDPQNLGACIRTANAAGVDAVIIPRDKSVAVTSTVRKVASGGVENTPVITVTNLARAINRLQTAGIWIVGTDNNADKTLYELDLAIPLAIVMGAEGKGLRRNTREHCDYLASLPMHGMVESLNVSVAAGVCLYETLRQRGLR